MRANSCIEISASTTALCWSLAAHRTPSTDHLRRALGKVVAGVIEGRGCGSTQRISRQQMNGNGQGVRPRHRDLVRDSGVHNPVVTSMTTPEAFAVGASLMEEPTGPV